MVFLSTDPALIMYMRLSHEKILRLSGAPLSKLILMLPGDDRGRPRDLPISPSKGTAVGIGEDTVYREAAAVPAVGSQLVASSYPASYGAVPPRPRWAIC